MSSRVLAILFIVLFAVGVGVTAGVIHNRHASTISSLKTENKALKERNRALIAVNEYIVSVCRRRPAK